MFGLILKYLKPYWKSVVALLAVIALQVWTSLQLPALMANIINNGIMKGDLNYVWWTGMAIVGFATLTSACAFLANFLSARLGAFFMRDLRNDFFEHVLSLIPLLH